MSLSSHLRLLSRLALPICLNYLYMIEALRLTYHEENNTPQTAFATVTILRTHTSPYRPWLCISHFSVVILQESPLFLSHPTAFFSLFAAP